jgi:hypothetical protein
MLHISTTTNNTNNKFGKHILAAAKDQEKNVMKKHFVIIKPSFSSH